MDYYQAKSLQDIVNQKGTKLWIKMNDNSKARSSRDHFVRQNGGFFIKAPEGWVWKSPVEEKNGYWLKNINTDQNVFFENMSEFGEKHGLSSVKICELLNGKRKTYKGWTAVEIRDVKQESGRNEKIKEEKREKIAITKAVTFENKETGQILLIDNINQFAKVNNMDSNALYKVARGKLKSYKNLKLFNPLEKYQDLSDT